MELVRWNPFGLLLRSFFADDLFAREESPRRFSPAIDVTESPQGYTITAELPGVGQEDISVSVADGMLTLEGEKRGEKKEEGNVTRIERYHGRFSRSFRLPGDADGEGVKASFGNGLLTLSIPRREEAKPRQIPVHLN